MERWARLFDRLMAPFLLLGEMATALMCLHIVAEIVAAWLFRAPIEGTQEIVARWYMVAIVLLPLVLIQRNDGHIKAELFTRSMRGRPRAILDTAINLGMVALCALLTWYTFRDALDATIRAERVELTHISIDTWPTRWLVPFGFGTTGIAALLALLKRLGDAVRGEKPAAP
jgi:TRAP-type C4-dicarboxylate transport system permease small subunit